MNLIPDINSYKKILSTSKFNIIPVWTRIKNPGFSPFDAYCVLRNGNRSFMLESARPDAVTGKYSVIGTNPRMVFKSKNRNCRIIRNGTIEEKEENPFKVLKEIFKSYRPYPGNHLPDFSGGAVGFFSYDCNRQIERLPSIAKDDLDIEDVFLLFVDEAVVFDNFSSEITVVSNIHTGDSDEAVGLYRNAEKKISEICKRLSGNLTQELKPTPGISDLKLQSTLTKQEFEKIVEKCREYISAGDIFQANLSQRLSVPFDGDALKLYSILTKINPSPFACLLEFDDLKIVSCSPERLIKLKDRNAATRPIAGTRPRGKNETEDEDLSSELILHPKERAEHIMLVDLERNDLGRVCEYGTVRVSDLMVLEKYSHVIHIVSNVVGVLHKDRDMIDLTKAVFPGGTITGAPKVRCMEIIEELEPVRRNIYTGSIGYMGYNGNMDLNIAIRTFVVKDGKAYIQVGSGIVWDSEPEREYFETLHKAEALIKAMEEYYERGISLS